MQRGLAFAAAADRCTLRADSPFHFTKAASYKCSGAFPVSFRLSAYMMVMGFSRMASSVGSSRPRSPIPVRAFSRRGCPSVLCNVRACRYAARLYHERFIRPARLSRLLRSPLKRPAREKKGYPVSGISQLIQKVKHCVTGTCRRQTSTRKSATCATIFARFCLQNRFLTRRNGRQGACRPDSDGVQNSKKWLSPLF